MIITVKRLYRNGYSPITAQTALYRAASDAIKSGYRVTRVFTVGSNGNKTIKEVIIS